MAQRGCKAVPRGLQPTVGSPVLFVEGANNPHKTVAVWEKPAHTGGLVRASFNGRCNQCGHE